VRSFDTDTLAIESLDSLKIAAADPAALELLARGRDFRGQPLIDARGTKLGKVVQIRLDEHGRVVEYRARRGPLGWLKPATKIKPAQLRTGGGDIGVVHAPAATTPPALAVADQDCGTSPRPAELPTDSNNEAPPTPEDTNGGS
jgi:PRC-barrel domain protein